MKFTARIQVLSFGDGTGYFGTELYPPAGRRRAAAKDKSYLSPKGASMRFSGGDSSLAFKAFRLGTRLVVLAMSQREPILIVVSASVLALSWISSVAQVKAPAAGKT